jgi:hypothetical protein
MRFGYELAELSSGFSRNNSAMLWLALMWSCMNGFPSRYLPGAILRYLMPSAVLVLSLYMQYKERVNRSTEIYQDSLQGGYEAPMSSLMTRFRRTQGEFWQADFDVPPAWWMNWKNWRKANRLY